MKKEPPDMNALSRRDAATSTDATLDVITEASTASMSIVPSRRPAASRGRARVSSMPPTTPGTKLAPAKVELVEQFDTGQRFLRAYIDGHFYWQPVSDATGEIRDRGVWMTGRDFHEAYWVNYGAYRRRAGSYHPVEQRGATTKVPAGQ
jgi:hypothetical protein